MRLPNVGEQFDALQERQRNLTIELADGQNHKRDQDIEVGAARLIIKSPNGTRYELKVSDSGTVSASTV
jgi:hypothetical protein|tara:strand:- start:1060 stop:1266 length:207 start_codon:yes stop_codon:yes gene_type:complete